MSGRSRHAGTATTIIIEWSHTNLSSGNVEGLNLLDFREDLVFCHIKITLGLQPKPELRAHTKELRQSKGSVSSDRTLTVNDFIDSPRRDSD